MDVARVGRQHEVAREHRLDLDLAAVDLRSAGVGGVDETAWREGVDLLDTVPFHKVNRAVDGHPVVGRTEFFAEFVTPHAVRLEGGRSRHALRRIALALPLGLT